MVLKDIAIGKRGRGFDSWAGEIENSVTKGSSPLRLSSELCCPDAEMGPANRYTLRPDQDLILKFCKILALNVESPSLV